MRWVWLFLWLALVFIQLMAFLLRTWHKPAQAPEVAGYGEGLLELAKLTNAEWAALLGELAVEPQAPGNADPVDWEVWILELSEAQRRLEKGGIEVTLLEDLRRWLSVTHRENSTGPVTVPVNDYLFEVISWMEGFTGTSAGCQLQRLKLEPGSESGFPDLYFELDGDPVSMGRCLLHVSGDPGPWQVGHLQLVREEARNAWWLMGNCRYVPGSK